VVALVVLFGPSLGGCTLNCLLRSARHCHSHSAPSLLAPSPTAPTTQSWLDAYLSGGTSSLTDSMAKYGQLTAVLATLAAMDGRKLRAAWVDFTDTDWSAGGGADEDVGAALQLGPPGFDEMYGSRGGAAAAKASSSDALEQ